MSTAGPNGTKPFFARYSWWILIAIWALLPYLFFQAKYAVQSNTNKVQDWIPKTFSETKELGWFRQHFVADQFVVISWEGCELGDEPGLPGARPDDPRIEKLAQALVPDPGQPVSGTLGKYFKSVNTARRVLNRITGPPSNVPYAEAVRRLQGSLIGPNGRHTAVVVFLTQEAVDDFRTAIGRGVGGLLTKSHKPGVLFDVMESCGIPFEQAHVGGPPVDNVSIDEEGDKTMVRLVAMAMVFGLGLAWYSLRSIKLTLIVFACGLLSAMTGLALVHINGDTTDAVVLSMPSLLYILAISGSIHLINYYRDEIAERGLFGAPDRALKHGWRPTLFCNVTTALGLGSLYASDIVPIRKFGVYSAWGVVAMLAILFLYLPAALTIWPDRKKAERLMRKEEEKKKHSGIEEWMDHVWMLFGGWVIRRHRLVLTACLVLMAFVAYGLMHTRTQIDLLKLFHPSARILHDYVWLEERLGRLIPMEIVLRFNPQSQTDANKVDPTDPQRFYQMSFLERMESVALVQDVIERQFGVNAADVVGRSMSAATFAPPVDSESTSTLSFARRSGLNKRLEQSREQFKTSGYFGTDPRDDAELWRVSLRIAAFEDVDYGAFVRELQHTVEPVLAAHQARGQVLGEVVGKRQSDRYAGASVFIWNRSGQPVQGEEPVQAQQRKDRQREQAILADTLKTLLTRARLRVAVNDTDPATIPVTYLERLQSYDCVVLVGEFSDADVQMIRNHGGRVVDTRGTLATQIAHATDSGRQVLTAGPAGIAAVYTGVVPIVYKAQRTLLDSLIQSSFWSFVTITPLMMFVSRSIPAGAIAMLPNILPILVIFGGMGWFGFPVDIGSMMAASIALGVAVDDTIHFMTWFRDDLDRTHDRNSAILAAYRRCATPTTQAALVNGLGLSVFALSTFMPTRKFGWLMLVILIAGLIAELVLTPALLASPLGTFFKPRKRKTSPGDAAAEERGTSPEEILEEVTAVAGAAAAAAAPPRSHIGTVCRTLSQAATKAAKERRAAG